jgi:alkylhydroperoxidase family enzyme
VSRLEALPPGDADPEVRELLARLPALPHFTLLAHAQSAFAPRHAYGEALMRRLELPDVLRETAILRIAARTHCGYVAAQHHHAAVDVGMADSLVHAVEHLDGPGAGDDELSSEQSVVIRLVDGMLLHYGADEAAVAAVRDALGARQLVELGLVVERYLGLCILLNSLAVPPAAAMKLTPVTADRTGSS